MIGRNRLQQCFAAIVGDIAPGDGISKEEKNRQESAAMDRIRGMLGQESVAGMAVQALTDSYGLLCTRLSFHVCHPCSQAEQ